MCVIMAFTPGSMMNKEQFFNAVYNNWHGWGLILKDANDKLQVLKGFNEEGTDPEVLWKLLNDNIDIDRYLHVRHSTKGSTDESNLHPFPVYNSTTREIHFMHNGTLHGFGQYTSGKSDTLEFCEKILAPSLLRWVGPEGKGDYTDPEFVPLIIEKQWTTGSTGLFISNDLPMKRIGNGWKEYEHPKNADDSKGLIYVSNTLYFEKVSRGPRFQKLEAERKAREAKAVEEAKKAYSTSGNSSNEQTSAKRAGVIKFVESNLAKDDEIIRAMNTVVSRFDLDDPHDLVKLTSATYEEWLAFVDEDAEQGLFTTAALIEHLLIHVRKLTIANHGLKLKQKRAENRIREFVIAGGSVEEKEEIGNVA